MASLSGVKLPGARASALKMYENTPLMVTEEWEQGSKEVRKITEVVGTLQRDATMNSSCGWQDVCFCTSFSCKMPSSDWKLADFPLMLPEMGEDAPVTARRLKEGGDDELETPPSPGPEYPKLVRSLQANFNPNLATVAESNRASIDVVFGIQVTGGSKLLGKADLASAWEFSESHEASQPWAQRNMYAFCTQLSESLRVTKSKCWIEHFRSYVLARQERFPIMAAKFNQYVTPFADEHLIDFRPSKIYLWLRNGKVKASHMNFQVDFSLTSSSGKVMEYKKNWDDYLKQWNLDSSIYAKGAWHTANIWVRAEATESLMISTILTLALVVILALVGMLTFTKDFRLSLMVVAATCGVIAGLTWFITAVCSWPIGPIEVIALIVFIGYAVTYSLHIAHRYGSPDAVTDTLEEEDGLNLTSERQKIRYQRTLFALRSIGKAAIGSAATTAGCSVFLLFCTLTIFKKLGGVVLAVTLMSIFAALVPLPAALLMVGPINPGNAWFTRPRATLMFLLNFREEVNQYLKESHKAKLDRKKSMDAQRRAEKEATKAEAAKKAQEIAKAGATATPPVSSAGSRIGSGWSKAGSSASLGSATSTGKSSAAPPAAKSVGATPAPKSVAAAVPKSVAKAAPKGVAAPPGQAARERALSEAGLPTATIGSQDPQAGRARALSAGAVPIAGASIAVASTRSEGATPSIDPASPAVDGIRDIVAESPGKLPPLTGSPAAAKPKPKPKAKPKAAGQSQSAVQSGSVQSSVPGMEALKRPVAAAKSTASAKSRPMGSAATVVGATTTTGTSAAMTSTTSLVSGATPVRQPSVKGVAKAKAKAPPSLGTRPSEGSLGSFGTEEPLASTMR
eukprot:TRINITY_DN1528_c1_g2_i1.p1 TRINITY_DN1528_c1_g2~~TRINITY_DN1528_c1_g2_i1.p1  ORF type:complete len:867 (+),score=160.20 TRINITY_DN1528_c1_g2_i1:44-2602(+)